MVANPSPTRKMGRVWNRGDRPTMTADIRRCGVKDVAGAGDHLRQMPVQDLRPTSGIEAIVGPVPILKTSRQFPIPRTDSRKGFRSGVRGAWRSQPQHIPQELNRANRRPIALNKRYVPVDSG